MKIQDIISAIAYDIVAGDLTEGGYFIVRETDGSLSYHYASTNWPPIDEETLEAKDCIYVPIPQISGETWAVIEDHREKYEQELYWAIMEGYSSWAKHVEAGRKSVQRINSTYSSEKRKKAAKKAWKKRRSGA